MGGRPGSEVCVNRDRIGGRRHRAVFGLGLMLAISAWGCDDDDEQDGESDLGTRTDGLSPADARPDQATTDLALPDLALPDAEVRDAEFVPDFEPPDAQADLEPPDAEVDATAPDAEIDATEPDAEIDAFVPDANLDVLCDSDADCPSDDYCERVAGVCRPGCRREVGTCSAGLGCDENHQCSDAECGPAEICGNDLDENCDGRIDEPEFCTVTCVEAAPCVSAASGVCAAGSLTCPLGRFGPAQCTPNLEPTDEICGNATDEDCDGAVDEAAACPVRCDLGAACDTGLLGVCRAGVVSCPGGPFDAPVCEGDASPSAEICGDGLDNNCNGRIDDPDTCLVTCIADDDCDTGIAGSCASGRVLCPEGAFGAPTCEPRLVALFETCGNGLDDDCDGAVDEAAACPPPCVVGAVCDTGLLGRCGVGATACPDGPGGAATCEAATGEAPEVCGNGVDEDCDGVADQPAVCPAGDRCAAGLANLASAPARISPFGVEAERPTAARGTDHYGVAWYEPVRGGVVFTRIDDSGQRVGASLLITDGAANDPALAWQGDHWLLLYAAFDDASGTRRIFRRDIGADGQLSGDAVAIAEPHPDARRPSIATGEGGRLAAVWYVGDGGNRRLRAVDLLQDPPVPFNAGAANGVAGQIPHPIGAAIGFDGAANAWHLGLLAPIDFQTTLDLRVYAFDGSLVAGPVNLSAGSAFGGALAFGSNRYMAAWQELFGTMARIIGTAGQLPLPASTLFDNGRLPGSMVFDGSQFALANAIDAGEGRDLAFRQIDAVGNGLGVGRPVMRTAATEAWRPSLMFDAVNDYGVVWEEAAPDREVAEVWFARGAMVCP